MCSQTDVMNKNAVILLVEDDPHVGAITVDLLAAWGHKAELTGSSGSAFVLLTAPHKIEVVLLDLQLGAERGEALVAKLRLTDSPIPPIIILSAQSMPELVIAGRAMGAVGILRKPCSVHKMMEAIELAVG